MKKGFILIELLAVIVILAIIALIATPIILGIINDAKKESQERSAELYLSGVELAIARKNLTTEFKPQTCEIKANNILECDSGDLTVEGDGEIPTEGTIKFGANNKVIEGTLTFGESFTAEITDGKIKIKDVSSEETPVTPVSKPCSYVDSADDTGDDIGVVDLNDVVTCGSENFYVMENKNNEVTMLSMYNLYVGKGFDENTLEEIELEFEPTNKQSELAIGDNDTKVWYGVITFSNDTYWLDSNWKVLPEYGSKHPAWVYNERANIYTYVNEYERILQKELNVGSARATLISYEEALDLKDNKGNPNWLYNTAYFTGTSYGADFVYVVEDGSISTAPSGDAGGIWHGVRPVVNISINEIGE